MKMIAHRTPSMNRPSRLGGRLAERCHKALPDLVIIDNFLTPITAIHDACPAVALRFPAKADAKSPRDTPPVASVPRAREWLNHQELPKPRTDPFPSSIHRGGANPNLHPTSRIPPPMAPATTAPVWTPRATFGSAPCVNRAKQKHQARPAPAARLAKQAEQMDFTRLAQRNAMQDIRRAPKVKGTPYPT